jgi:hypothetical protein
MRMELLQLGNVRVEEASRPLCEKVASIKLLLAHVGVSLEPTQARIADGLGVTPVQASCPLDSSEQKSSMVEEGHLHGCFSPHGSLCPPLQPDMWVASESKGMDGALAPGQITQELNELCGEPPMMPPLESGSFKAVVMTTSPPQLPISLDSGGVLAHRSDALFAKELCGLLTSLEMASLGYGKDIACILAGKASDHTIKKVEQSLRKVSLWSNRRKRGVARKASVTVCLVNPLCFVRLVDLLCSMVLLESSVHGCSRLSGLRLLALGLLSCGWFCCNGFCPVFH